MLENNEKIVLPGKEALDALKEIEFILISLHKMGSYYAEKPGALEEYRKATTDFIDDCAVTQRLAKVRRIVSMPFDDSLGDDEMDDMERYFSDLKFWEPSQPMNRTSPSTEKITISKGIIEQVTCKRNELLVFFTDQQDQSLLITFHNPAAFKSINAITSQCEIYEEKDSNLSQEVARIAPDKSGKNYCFKNSSSGEVIFSVIAGSYSIERI
ncbi:MULTISPECIES: hypothetical protein [unclassified Pseudomonas]|uniref:hypothetical protein n=1 Tax=unclassified Pseudomonas TaxID=196821 RepID=UPI001F58641C|nr:MULTISPECIES: hypothetical protein [unclassified Pseudomonas]